MTEAAAAPLPGQIPLWARIAVAAAGALLFLIALAFLPLPVPPYLDFQVLYHANMGLLRGIAVYDHAGQVSMIARLAGVAPERVYVLPFPYPPWYALSTLWLAWLPIQVAARLWFGISLLLVIASSWLLTDGWAPVKRLIAAFLAVVFVPVIGSLFVGQYGFPVLLGAALMVYALKHERALLVGLAAMLLTFKPHVGGLILLCVLLWLWQRKDRFSRRALLYILGAAILLFCLGFLADPAWPVSYIRSLLGFQTTPGVGRCDQCSSLSVLLAEWLRAGAVLHAALFIGIGILCALAALWLLTRRVALRDAFTLVAVPVLIVLLASPYLLKYDFVLLLIPLALLAGRLRGLGGWLLFGVAYTLPVLALALPPRAGDLVLVLSAVILLAALYSRKQPLDVSLPAA